ncbi:MAG: hypothetical protein CSB03_00850, partial [Bacteroidia bacterium]
MLFFLLFAVSTQAQNSKEKILQNLLEDLVENTDEQRDYSEYVEDLETLLENPINLNIATVSDLEKIPFLSELQIANLLKYREEVARMYSIYELQIVKGFTPELLENLQYFVFFGEEEKTPVNLKNALRYSRNTLMLRGQRGFGERVGYQKKQESDFANSADFEKWQKRRYLGNAWKYYVRYESQYKDKYRVGIVAEKDAGEEFFSGTQKRGFDHYAGFLQVNDIGILKTAIVGDYSPRFGQGLAVWGGYDLGKSVSFLNVSKRNEGLKKYSST